MPRGAVVLHAAGSFEVTVTSVSLPPLVSRRGLSHTTQRLSHASGAVVLMSAFCPQPSSPKRCVSASRGLRYKPSQTLTA